jgi:hypothetical protein
MDWAEDEERAPGARSAAEEDWRDTRGDPRVARRGLEERLEGWVSRGRELVDGVSGTRPGTRPPGRGAEREGSGGRGRLDGVGRWVEGTLDWLLDDREDWREPWQEEERPAPRRGEPAPAPPLRSRAPLEAISRRGLPSPERRPSPPWSPPRTEAPPAPNPRDRTRGATAPSSEGWPEEDTFTVPRWRREEPPPPRAADPLANDAPGPPPGRPLPRSTRRR